MNTIESKSWIVCDARNEWSPANQGGDVLEPDCSLRQWSGHSVLVRITAICLPNEHKRVTWQFSRVSTSPPAGKPECLLRGCPWLWHLFFLSGVPLTCHFTVLPRSHSYCLQQGRGYWGKSDVMCGVRAFFPPCHKVLNTRNSVDWVSFDLCPTDTVEPAGEDHRGAHSWWLCLQVWCLSPCGKAVWSRDWHESSSGPECQKRGGLRPLG